MLDASFAIYRSRFAVLLLIAVICRVIPILLAVYFAVTEATDLRVMAQLGASLLSLVVVAIGVGASTFVVSDAYLGRETTVQSAFARAMPRIWHLIGISILTSLAVGVGFVMLIVPGLLLFGGLLLSPVVSVIESTNVSESMNRSWQLSGGYKGKLLLTMLVAFLLLLVPSITLGAVGGVAAGVSADQPVGLAFFVASLVLQVFAYPFVYVVQTVLYYDLRVRKEGFDLELLAAAMPPAEPA